MHVKNNAKYCFNEVNFKKYASIFGGLIFLGILFQFVPSLLKVTPPYQIALPGSEMRKVYTKPSLPIEFKIYLFNITNKDEVTHGARPMLQEIGPYVFEVWKEKFDVFDSDEDDTLTFNMKKTFIFRSDLSNGLTGNEEITTVHALIMGMSLAVNVNRKPMLKMVNKAVNSIFHQPKDPFWSGRVMDYLFDGIEIDCTSEDFAAQAVCSVLDSGEAKIVQPLREGFYKFSVFGAMNGSSIGVYKVDRGIKNIHNVGRIISFNHEIEMEVWNGDECNRYKGTDSTIFPPAIKKEDGLWLYEPDLCLSIRTQYESESSYRGVPTLRFGLDFGDAGKNEKLQCYCSEAPTDCPRGTINLFDCIGAPIVVSLPHFYRADPSLLTEIQSGLSPNDTKHAFYIDYETTTGSETNSAKRLQFNLDVVPVVEVESMKHLPEVLMPLFWVEEGSALLNNETYAILQKYQQQLLILKILQWTAIIAGAVGAIFSTFIYFTIRNSSTVVPITKAEEKVDDKISNADITSNYMLIS